jgi:hypothetical protein
MKRRFRTNAYVYLLYEEGKTPAVKLKLANKEIVNRLLVQKRMRVSTYHSVMYTGPHIVYRDFYNAQVDCTVCQPNIRTRFNNAAEYKLIQR